MMYRYCHGRQAFVRDDDDASVKPKPDTLFWAVVAGILFGGALFFFLAHDVALTAVRTLQLPKELEPLRQRAYSPWSLLIPTCLAALVGGWFGRCVAWGELLRAGAAAAAWCLLLWGTASLWTSAIYMLID